MATFLTVDWAVPYSEGLMPQDPSDVAPAALTVPWTSKLGTVVLPYDATDLTVTPGTPDPVPGGGGGGVGGGGGTGGGSAPPLYNPPASPAPAPGTVIPSPSPVVKPPPAPKLRIATRIDPGFFLRSGTRVSVVLDQKATVELRISGLLPQKRGKAVRKPLTATKRFRTGRGKTSVRMRPSALGRSRVRAAKRLRATLVAEVTYADGSTITVSKGFKLKKKPKSSRRRRSGKR